MKNIFYVSVFLGQLIIGSVAYAALTTPIRHENICPSISEAQFLKVLSWPTRALNAKSTNDLLAVAQGIKNDADVYENAMPQSELRWQVSYSHNDADIFVRGLRADENLFSYQKTDLQNIALNFSRVAISCHTRTADEEDG
jgi:hypothetical protein